MMLIAIILTIFFNAWTYRLILDAFQASGNNILRVLATLFGDELPREKRTGHAGEGIGVATSESRLIQMQTTNF